MDPENLLEQFRENWKQELKQQDALYEGTDSVGKEQLSTDRQHSKDNQGKTNKLHLQFDSGKVLTFHTPCVSESAETSCGLKYIDDSTTKCTLDKRKTEENDSCTSKRKRNKSSKFDDIFSDKEKGVLPQERLLDRLIQDIDEITAIPFFDISIPREVAVNIFRYLDIKDLCSCAQVSKSWQVLSEDELIWCRICHRLGRETLYTTREKQHWKQIVRHNVERHRLLISNWKARIGKVTQLEHTRGKILCSVHVHKDSVVAGYTSGEVKYWNLTTDHSCIFQPTNTSLSISEAYEIGTEQNIVKSVVTFENVTAALYSQGNVDIWSLQTGSSAFQTYSPSTRDFPVTSLCLSRNSKTLVTKYGPIIDVLYTYSEEEFHLLSHIETAKEIKSIKLLELETEITPVIFSTETTVNVLYPKRLENSTPDPQSIDSPSNIVEIHNILDCPVSVFDAKESPALLAVAVGSYMHGTGGDWFKVHLYDIQSGKSLQSLHSHNPGDGPATMVTCLNLKESPPNEVVTASTDRKLRLYDLRQPCPSQILGVHPHKVTCVQMDEWKVISGGDDGYIYGSVHYWDRRMGKKLWHITNRHPVQYCSFQDKHLIIGNIPWDKFPQGEDFEVASHSKYRGSVQVYDFLEDLTTQDVPEICLSTYDMPGASKYNIALAMPYDVLSN